MEGSPSAHSPDARDSRPSFRKPANEASRRNYRRHSPSLSHSRSPSPGGWKRDRSPSYQEDGGSKKGRTNDADSGKGREDAQFKRGTDMSRSYGNHSRDRHGRAESYDHNFSRRHSSHYDRNYQVSRSDYSRYDEGRYARRSPERSTRERNAEDSGYRRREDRDRDERLSDARAAADRDKAREEEDVRDRYKSRDREARRGQERSGEKYRDDGSDVEAQQSRHGKRVDNGTGRKDAVALEGRDRDIDKRDSREGLKAKADVEKAKERESGRRGREDGKESESYRSDGDGRRNKDKGHRGHDEHRRRPFPSYDNKGYSSDEPEGTDELSRERSHGHNHSKRGDKDKKYSGDKGRSKFSSLEPAPEAQEAGMISDPLDESKRMDDDSKGSKWGPEADNPDSTTTSSDPEVAKMAAMKAAALVNINLGGFKSVDEKKKMLWGSKEQKPAAASGTNRWDTVQFADRDRQEKFNKLMGVKGDVGGDGQGNTNTSFTTEKQEELQQDLEKQFTAGLRRRDGRTVGLGL
ncbi:hypothetical protein GOP47_0013354 [Adiantum capillus-veneris]|uniref:Small acidic protein-like domain-containing protein n=1 Tax=Adiantum capillus-veneris TaxID=13818 RepID=A0A9D4UPM0_ADICA|nr:hypothetical protein GOP47_0013354 [Adiantum capillus-veneris]